jgi:hypothetical protein
MSIRIVIYALQVHRSGEIKMFDFGRRVNLKRYGVPYPPFYNYTNIHVPTLVLRGRKDPLGRPHVNSKSKSQ